MSESILKNGLPYYVEKSEDMKPYWDGLNQGKFMTTQCERCNAIHFPPTPKLCTKCYGFQMKWIELPLSGTVSTFTEVNSPPEGFFGNYVLASVKVDKLEKDILGRFIGDKIEMGDKVKITFELVADQALIVFKK